MNDAVDRVATYFQVQRATVIAVSVMAAGSLVGVGLGVDELSSGGDGSRAEAWFTLSAVFAAAVAGGFAAQAARETGRQRIHATTPAFIELSPSAPVPSGELGLKSIDQKNDDADLGELSLSPGFANAAGNDLEHPCDAAGNSVRYVVQWWKILHGESASQEESLELRRVFGFTAGDLRAVIMHDDRGGLGVSVPLMNVGGGIALIDDASVRLHEPGDLSIARARRASGVNRSRVPPGGTTRVSLVIAIPKGTSAPSSVTFGFRFTDLHGYGANLIKVTVQRDPNGQTEKWFVTELKTEGA